MMPTVRFPSCFAWLHINQKEENMKGLQKHKSVASCPFDISTFAEGLDGHLAYGNSVHAQHTVTIQRLILTDCFLQIAMVQRYVFCSPFLIGGRLHLLLVKLLRLN